MNICRYRTFKFNSLQINIKINNKYDDWEKPDLVKEILKHIDYWKEAPVWTPETISNETKDWFKNLGEK